MRITAESYGLGTFENEEYSCVNCNRELLDEEVNEDTWRCDECNSKISIDIGIRHKLVRLHPEEMTDFDMVYDQYTEEFHGIMGIKQRKDIYHIGVKGYRAIPVREEELVHCMISYGRH